jgi:hypothetical protein
VRFNSVRGIRSVAAILLAATAALCCSVSPARGDINLLSNGNFEDTGIGNFAGGVTGWTSGPGSYTHIGKNNIPGKIHYAVLNHAGQNFGISQSFDVTAGHQYAFTYEFGVSRESTAAENILHVTISSGIGTSFFHVTDSTAGPQTGQSWERFSYIFTAPTSGDLKLTFRSVGATNGPYDSVFVDRVKITPVPELCTCLLMALMMTMTFLRLRRSSFIPAKL